MKISKLMNSVAATALSGVMAFGQMGAALADDAGHAQQQQGQPVTLQQGSAPQVMTSVDMLDMASDYSMENGGRVGIFINIAPSTSLTPSQVGDGLIKKFAKDGIEASYYVNFAQRGESSVTFYMNGSVWPGYSFGSIREVYPEIVKSYRAMKAIQLSGLSDSADTLAMSNP